MYMYVYVRMCSSNYGGYYMYVVLCIWKYIAQYLFINQKDKKGKVIKPPNHSPDKQTYIARDTWTPNLDNWGGWVNDLLWLANSPHTSKCLQFTHTYTHTDKHKQPHGLENIHKNRIQFH